MVDTRDLKSLSYCSCAGSSPASGTLIHCSISVERVFYERDRLWRDLEHIRIRECPFFICTHVAPSSRLLLQLRLPTSQERKTTAIGICTSAPTLSTPLSPLLGFILEPINRNTRVRNLVISKKMLYFAPDYGSAWALDRIEVMMLNFVSDSNVCSK